MKSVRTHTVQDTRGEHKAGRTTLSLRGETSSRRCTMEAGSSQISEEGAKTIAQNEWRSTCKGLDSANVRIQKGFSMSEHGVGR